MNEYQDHYDATQLPTVEACTELPAEMSKTPTIPRALYPCHYCYCSWHADDLYWHEDIKAWVCTECEGDIHERGVCLADVVGHEVAEAKSSHPQDLLNALTVDEQMAEIATLKAELAEARAAPGTSGVNCYECGANLAWRNVEGGIKVNVCRCAESLRTQVKRLVELGQAMYHCTDNKCKCRQAWGTYLRAENLQPEGEYLEEVREHLQPEASDEVES